MTLLTHYNELLSKSVETKEWPGRNITDKGTHHCYIQEYYDKKFTPLKNSPIKLLEIGIENGYSMDLWLSWFSNAEFVGIDPFQPNTVNRLNNIPLCKAIDADAFEENTVNLFEDETFDIIIEDGPHTLETQIFAAKYWVPKLKPGGFLIIEDLQSPDTDVKAIAESLKNNKNLQILFYDLRYRTGRWDDAILEIQKK